MSAPDFQSINYSSSDSPDKEKIAMIGEWFLFGSPQADDLKLSIGATVLGLLKEDLNSGYFKNLKDRIDYLTDGVCGGKFDEVLGKK